MSTVYFVNPGEIDPRLITTLGVNVKVGDSPIGFFGTGLKYAIAVLLRTEHSVEVRSGLKTYYFRQNVEIIRDKLFQLVQMRRDAGQWQSLGFTTDLGKNWTVEHAYRELHSNSMDEGGWEGKLGEAPPPKAGQTCIVVAGAGIAAAHRARHSFILDPKRTKLFSNGQVEVYAGSSEAVFYRGFAAKPLHVKSAFTYNILGEMKLTEDRTLADTWTTNYRLAVACVEAGATREVQEVVLTAKETYEQIFSYGMMHPSEACLDLIEEIMDKRPGKLLDAARQMYAEHRRRVVKREELVVEAWQADMIADASAKLTVMGFQVAKYPIKLANLGRDLLGLAEVGTIWLDPKALSGRLLLETILEEYVHLEFNVADESRRMQEVLFREILRLGALVAEGHPGGAK